MDFIGIKNLDFCFLGLYGKADKDKEKREKKRGELKMDSFHGLKELWL